MVRGYMAEHLELYARMADPFGWEKTHGDDLSGIDPQNLVASGSGVGDGEAGADASKLLGRMALLKVSEQEKMLQEIGELYTNEIQRLTDMGENDLEITELPLKAKTIHKEVWKQGAEPGGDNAFADNTYIEKVNMAILKKPMKASEVKASQEGLTGGKTWDEYKTEKKAAVKEYFDQHDVRSYIDDRSEKIGRKIRDTELKHVPYMVIVGEKEAAEGLVSYRQQGGGEQGTVKFEDFSKKINEEVRRMTEKY
mgnify:CR=1 FL=1